MENHRFEDAKEVMKREKGSTLICCSCTELPATRKCMGILDDAQIDDLCTQLQRSVARKWPEILSQANVGGERKLALMLEQVRTSALKSIFKRSNSLYWWCLVLCGVVH